MLLMIESGIRGGNATISHRHAIPNTVMTDHTLYTFPAAKAFASRKIIIFEM